MTIPDSIPISSVDLGFRGRSEYKDIDSLAESIQQHGLIQPLVLQQIEVPAGPDVMDGIVTGFKLVAGGRRLRALEALGVTALHHASTSDPTRPGFILAGEADPLTHTLREIAENLDRHDMPWRDELNLIVRAYRLAKQANDADGIYYTQRHYGVMLLGTGYADLGAALAIYDDVTTNPARYVECNNIRQAYSILLKVNSIAIAKLALERGLCALPALIDEGEPLPAVPGEIPGEPAFEVVEEGATRTLIKTLPLGETRQRTALVGPEVIRPVIPLSKSFINTNGLDFMESCAPESFDHVITDPDYALDKTLLNSGVGNAPGVILSGVEQPSILDSLSDLYRLLTLAFRVVRPYGFLVFWYDIDHHEKLQNAARAAGWLTQRWPLTWRKLDYRSNAAPSHNFCKNEEWAMVCRKPDAVLAQTQMTSVFDCMTGKVTKELGHPFAKPYSVWKWIYMAIAIKGQIIFDPFVGSGSSAIAALQWGLRPVGCEISPDHYANLMCNLQLAYKRQLGENTKFS